MNLFSHVSIQEQILFVKYLAVMTKAGMPILDSLQLMKKQRISKMMTKILDQMISDVSNGQFLFVSLERFRNVFGDFMLNIIRVGETSGILHENLNYLAEELKKKRELGRKVKGALTYPIIILFTATAIVGLLTLYVFPKILPVLKNLKTKPPLPTRILISISDFMTAYGVVVFLGVIVGGTLLWFLVSKVKPVKFLFHRIVLITPLAGRISRNYNLTAFARTLGLLLKSDIKVVEALSMTAETMTNLVYREEMKKVAANVSRGEEISRHLENKTYLFPPMLSQMIAIGEKTGNLSESLLYLAELYEAELDDLTKNLSSVLEPVLMIILGVIVGFIALSIITPIYQMTQSL
ncbi:MAG: type II secretion system F family protein [Candidatus Magasanikbacteria bacterium]|nr:type II secretion system F family protein [Candidatus Magasanikbacteria bacterium]